MPIQQRIDLVARNELDGAIKALNKEGWKIESVTPDYISAESLAGVFLLLCTKIKKIYDPDFYPGSYGTPHFDY